MTTEVKVRDPICGMMIEPSSAAAKSTVDGEEVFFCSAGCRQRFESDAAKPTPKLVQLGAKVGSPKTQPLPSNEPSEITDIPVTGMTCAACARFIESTLQNAPGVKKAGVNFATSRATVEFDPTVTDVSHLIDQIKSTGYGVAGALQTDEASKQSFVSSYDSEQEARNRESNDLRKRLIVAVIFSIPVIVLGMAHGLIAFAGQEWVELGLTIPVVFYSGLPFYRGAWAALRHQTSDMNTLIAMGTGAAFIYSVFATCFPGLVSPQMPGMVMPPKVYFEASSAIITLILVGRF